MRRFSTVVASLLLILLASTAARGATLRAHGANAGPEGNDGVTVITFTYDIPFPINTPITGTYMTVDGTATVADNDYLPVNSTFTIPAGATQSNPIQISIIGDRRVEPDETFSVVVTSIVGGGAPPPRVLTIQNDDVLAVSVSNASVTEGNAGTTTLTFTVTSPVSNAVPTQATFVTADVTATAGQDYQRAAGTITFAAGQTQQTVNVTVLGDTLFEQDETLTLTVTPAGGLAAAGIGTIVNDDPPPPASVTIVSGNNQPASPGQPLAQPLVIQVRTATGAPSVGVPVSWRVVTGSAILGPSTGTTNAEGRASINATITSLGTVEIEAVVGQLPPVRFTFTSATTLGARATGPVAVPIANVLDQICGRDQEFNDVCIALSGLSNAQLTPTLERVAPQNSGAQAKVASEVVSAVTSSIASRLAAVRSGVDRVSLQRLTLNIDGRSVPLAAMADAFLPLAQDAPEDGYSGWSIFLSGNLGTGERKPNPGELGFDLDSRGLMIGVDRLFGQSVFGISLNLMQLDTELTDDAGSVDTTGYAVSIYGSRGGLFARSAETDTGTGTRYDGMHVDGSITLGRNQHDAEHHVFIDEENDFTATSENDADVFAVSLGAGFDLHRGRTDFDFALLGSWSRASIDDLEESGVGPLLLFVDAHDVESLTATAAFNVRASWPVSWGVVLPTLRAELIHEFEDDARLVTARFRRHLDLPFTIPLDRPDSNYGKIAAGIQGVFPHGISAYVEYTQDVLRSDLEFRMIQFNISKSF